jgi:glycine hydroxymethyltransferase
MHQPHRDEVFMVIEQEKKRQQDHIELIASENFVSLDILEAQGSILTNKYAEGYPKHRYYGGCSYVDDIETMAMNRACHVFECSYANVQPHSGSQANASVFLALMNPGDCFLGMALSAGGHLTHGSKVSMSGQWFKAVSYGVDETTHLIDYDRLEKMAHEFRPKMIIAGGSSYPRIIDFERFRFIADQVGAYLMVDMAHFSGLVAAKVHPSPFPYAHVVTSTTHKTLRGPRGGMILTNDVSLIKKINRAVFPGTQGGPLMHVIAAKAICFAQASTPTFHAYGQSILRNTKAMEIAFIQRGIELIAKGSDTHLLLLDLRKKAITGQALSSFLEFVGIVCNKNSIPNDPLPPKKTSGIRIGTPACTTRGFDEHAFVEVTHMMVDAMEFIEQSSFGHEIDLFEMDDWSRLCKQDDRVQTFCADLHLRVRALCQKFPLHYT